MYRIYKLMLITSVAQNLLCLFVCVFFVFYLLKLIVVNKINGFYNINDDLI